MNGRIGVARGTALYVGAVLGPGVLVLPALAMHAAGPASLLAWAAMLAVSVPIAAAFAALGIRYPDAGGVATFTRRAFGPTAGAVVGWWFFTAVPMGMVAGAMAGARYAATVLGVGPSGAAGIAAGMLAAAYAMNLVGLHLSGRLHLALTGGLCALLATVIVVSVPHIDATRFTPFAPHGVTGIGSAAAVLFVAICGWEAAAHLAGEFAHPRRQLPIVAAGSLSIIALLYAGLAICTVGVLGASGGQSEVPLLRLLGPQAGVGATAAAALCALLLTFGACFTFIAAAARAGAALGRDGAFPGWFAVTGADGVPRRSLAVQAGGAAVVAVAALAAPTVVDVDLLMRVFSVLVASVTLLGLASAVRLLGSPLIRGGAAVGATVVGGVAVCAGPLVVLPAAVAVAALIWRRRHSAPRGLPAGTQPARPSPATASRQMAVMDVQPRRSYDLVNPGAGISASTRSRPASER
ncbi:amino acid permease [Micromonospora sp. MED01]|uniref:APC family permease n=1 Tax=Micromonospora alfalfae TaxID=2911212 RepID=UPI001EE8F19E|nr:amino acid permease [Micromonospora alfalfae]MCG5466733.1 amino acid permease [Micromonospora alfalfae]